MLRMVPGTGHGGRYASPRGWATEVHLASLVFGFLFIVYVNRHGWFRSDEWDFLTHYDILHRPQDVFVPHNEHLSVLPVLIYRASFEAFGLRHYITLVAVLAFAHVVTAHLGWVLARRSGADAWMCTAVATVFIAAGGGYFNVTTPFQMSFVGSTAFGLGAIIALDVQSPLTRRRLTLGWALCLGSMFCSGLGTVFTLIAALFAALRHGRRGILVPTVPFAFYIVWFIAVGRDHVTALGMVGKATYMQLPDFVWTGLTAALDGVTGLAGAGPTLVLVLGAYLVHRRVWLRPEGQAAGALAIGSVLLFLAIGPGRLLFGPQYASQSRYVYEASAMLLVPSALAATAVAARSRTAMVTVLAILGMIVIRNAYQVDHTSRTLSLIVAENRARILAAGRLLSDGSPILADDRQLIDPDNLDVAGMRTLLRSGVVPLAEAPSESAPATLAARMLLQVSVKASADPVASGTLAAERSVGYSATPSGGGCDTVESVGDGSRAWFPVDGSAGFTVTSMAGGTMRLTLASRRDPSIQSKSTDFQLVSQQRTAVLMDAPGTFLGMTLPPGTTTVCGAKVIAG